MYARVVRFTDVSPERIDQIVKMVQESGGPPEGVESTGMQLLADAAQGTAVFIGYFETEEKMQAASAIFEAMDATDTPGTRASIDLAEVKIEMDA